MLLSRTGKLRPDRTSKEPCRDELTSSFGLHSQLEQAAVHARMNASKSVRISIISPSPSARPKRRASKVADARGVCFFNHNRTNFLDRDRIARSQLARYRHWINRARSLREFAQTPSNFLNQSLPIAHFFAFSPISTRRRMASDRSRQGI